MSLKIQGQIKRIVLVNPPNDPYIFEWFKYKTLPPLALLALATFLKEKGVVSEIKILDGQVIDMREIKECIREKRPEIVGISPFLASYNNTLEIARWSKRTGSKVILGGHYASPLAREILLHRGVGSSDYCVDYIIRGDGEEAFYKSILGIAPEEIPNVVYVSKPSIVKANKLKSVNFDCLPIANRDLVEIDLYFKNQRSLNVYSKIGCTWRDLTNSGCIFCARDERKMHLKSPDNFWHEVSFLAQKYNLDSIFDGRDDFLDDDEWLKKVSRLSFNYFNKVNLEIFARADRINDSSGQILKNLNVSKVILGIESGDETMLRAMHKGVTLRANKMAIKTLSRLGIAIDACFVLGAPGETKKSLDNTLSFAKEIKKLFEQPKVPFTILPGLLNPRPGAAAFSWLKEQTGSKYVGKDILNRDELSRDWIDNFCQVDYEYIAEVEKELISLNNKAYRIYLPN
jgi:anaerobic magnesium-protoporphyrin IX monomethyl ester cyclase